LFSFAVDGGDAYGDKWTWSAVEKDAVWALRSLTLRLMYLYSMYAIACLRSPDRLDGRPNSRQLGFAIQLEELEHRTLLVLRAASYTGIRLCLHTCSGLLSVEQTLTLPTRS
jgi:hypothetical protein